MLFGENGIIKKAQEAKDATERDQQETQQGLQDLNDQMSTILNGNSGSGTGSGETGDAEPKKVADNIGSVISETENTDLTDAYNNKITIPAGFHIVSTSEDSTVSYTYSGNGIPAVQDGIVVADSDGNQFVWIPVETIKNADGSTNTIELARYTFDIDVTLDLENEYISVNGTGAVKNKITDGSSLTDEWVELGGGWEYLEEQETSTTYDNTKAKDIEGFKTSVSQNVGYYIARYEASYRDGTKPYSKASTGTPDDSNGSTITEGMLWNFVTQPDAALAARNMYNSSCFESDLVNSYAWDTAIVFIQTYSGDSDYSMQDSLNNNLENTGTRDESTTDKVCNIFDMASNTFEWTTETSTYIEDDTRKPCVSRGGNYDWNMIYYTSNRYNLYSASDRSSNISFRLVLYVQ